MDYEQLATSAVINTVSKTRRLKAFVNSGDKEPSFDGHIYIFDNDTYCKENIKRVSVQVKGKGVKAKPKASIKYPVSITDLENYMHNGGAIFFVGYIDKDTGNTKRIYYSSLLPFKIRELLKRKKEGSTTLSITLNTLPTKEKELTSVFLYFYEQSQKQISFVGKKTPTIEELAKNGSLDGLTISCIGLQGGNTPSHFPRLMDGEELYMYANVKDGVAPIPVEYFSNISKIHMICTDDAAVSVNGITYFNGIKKMFTAERIVYHIGSSVTLSAPNVDETMGADAQIKVEFTIRLKGTLRERIQALEFLIAMFEAKSFEIGGVRCPGNFSDEELKKLNPEDYPDILKAHKRALAVLEKMNVKKDLPLDDFTEEDLRKLNSLIGAIEYDIPVRNVEGNLPHLINLDFGGLHLVMLCEKIEEGTYQIWDYFTKHIDVCVFGEDGERIPVSQYSQLKEDDFLSIDNLRLQSVVDDFKSIEPQIYIAENGNLIMLEMLKAYDREPKPELLDAAKQMYEWLETVGQYLTEEVMLLNSLQIIRRERELSFSENQKLFAVATQSDELAYRAGALILLDEQDEAEKVMSEMAEEERNEFMGFPITKFYTKSKEKFDYTTGANLETALKEIPSANEQ